MYKHIRHLPKQPRTYSPSGIYYVHSFSPCSSHQTPVVLGPRSRYNAERYYTTPAYRQAAWTAAPARFIFQRPATERFSMEDTREHEYNSRSFVIYTRCRLVREDVSAEMFRVALGFLDAS